VCNKDAFRVDFWPFLAIPPPLLGRSFATDSVYASAEKMASDKVEHVGRRRGDRTGRRPGSLAVRKEPEVPVTQGNGPENAAVRRLVPCDEFDGRA
jgi:hypothetical protein